MNKAYFLSPLTAKNFQWKMNDFDSFSEKTDFKFSINRELDVPSSVQSLTKKLLLQMIENDKIQRLFHINSNHWMCLTNR